jgi:tetratricopeptide (TPR) repeat protein
MWLAIAKSWVSDPTRRGRPYNWRHPGESASRLGRFSIVTLQSFRFLALLCLLLAFSFLCSADPADPFAAAAHVSYWEADHRFKKEPAVADAAWQFARACFDVAEYATNSSERALLAEQGIEACRKVLREDPKSAPAHYYFGMNLGQLARTRGIGALKLVDQMEHEFKIVVMLDEKYDFAGSDRNLGLLYRDAPSFGSIGSRSRAHKHLDRCVELSPDYPENRLSLIESLLKWSDRVGARRELNALEALWPNARKTLTGEKWASSWADWKKRLMQVTSKIEEAPKAIPSPRAKD